ncbi:amidohydrolase family protein [Sphingobium sp. EM0848]|uniref:amidohydrolase family protein n=1 Tax=Sphingobium sp. EM0848 TaxID=2743473 RepID=UPI00159C5358|nr:amidohydrolase family protein [Sphingobium sp. EM0848]
MNSKLIEKPIISADSHVTEPADIFKNRLSKKYEEIAPRMIRRPEGGDVFQIPGMDNLYPITLASAAGKRGKELADQAFANFLDCHTGGWDPKQRLKDQERDGIHAEILYPSLGMFLSSHDDVAYKSAMFGAYNEWLAEYCEAAPDRLIGLGVTALESPEQGIKDLRGMKELGMRGVMMPGYPVMEDYDSRIYDPFWEAAVDLDMPLSFHILTYKGNTGADKPRGPKLNQFIRIIRGNQDIIGMLIFGGVFERFPKLQVVCAEADAGWIPHFMYRMDHAVERSPHNLGDVILSKKPSDYLKENIYLTFQDDITAFKFKDEMNIDRMMWASDFPHLDSTYPHSQALLAEHTAGLTALERTKVLHDNVASLYKLAF